MKHVARRIVQGVAALLVLIVVAGLAAPFLRADRYGSQIRAALVRSLARRVELGRVRFNLFTGPGFTVDDVVIYDRAEFGVEPIAYVTQMDTRIRLLSLWTGHLEFSTLRLLEPSLNLVRRDGHGWNVQALLAPAFAGRTAAADFPTLLIRQGRLNFKFEDTKSIFYLTNADLDVASSPGGLELWFSGEPARTDRPARGFGRFIAKGRIDPGGAREAAVDLDLELKQAGIDDLSHLIRGRASGLHGLITARARLSGPVSGIALTGQAQVEDVHRWDLMPPKGEGWKLPLSGRIDLRAENVDLDAMSEAAVLPIAAHFHAAGLLSTLEWTWSVELKRLPVASALEVARHLGAPLPARLEVEGTASGNLQFSSLSPIQGSLTVRQLLLRAPRAAPVRIEEAVVNVAGPEYRMEPALVTFAPSETATAEASFNATSGTLRISATGRALPATRLAATAEHHLGTGRVPLLEYCEGGWLNGRLEYRRQGEAADWFGEFQMQNASFAIPGLSVPVRALSSNVTLAGDRVAMRGLSARAGPAELRGEYRYEPGAARPHQFSFAAPQLDAAQLEQLLLPALRRRQGFLARTLRLAEAEAPDWLSGRHAEGTLRIGAFTLAGLGVRDLRARLRWDGARISSTSVQFAPVDGSGAGYLVIALGESGPEYRMGARVKNLAWNGGRLDLEGVFTTSGTGPEVLANLKSEGSFEARGLGLAGPADSQFRGASGTYQFSIVRGTPAIQLGGLEVLLGAETYKGKGGTLADGRLQLDLSSGERQVKLAGAWSPFNLEVIANP